MEEKANTDVKQGRKFDKSKRRGKKVPSERDGVLSNRKDVPNKTFRKGIDNDFNYYNKNQQLIELATRVAFGKPAGVSLNLVGKLIGATSGTITLNDKNTKNYTPEILSIPLIPTIPTTAVGNQQLVDIAAQSIYAWVRHANSGHTNYDFPDLFMYVLGMRDVYALCGWLMRIVGVMNKFKSENLSLPRRIFEANNLNYDDFVVHQSEFIFFVNSVFKRINTLAVPKSLPLYEKAFNQFVNIYADDRCGKTQLYQYVPDGFFQFDATTYSTGSALVYNATLSGNTSRFNFSAPARLTYSQLVTQINNIINPLVTDEDIGIMSGDIRKAFGDGGLYSLGIVPLDLELQFIPDSFVVQQMHNVETLPSNFSAFGLTSADSKWGTILQTASGSIIQYIPYTPTTGTYTAWKNMNHLVDIDSEVPTTEEVTEALVYKFDAELPDSNQTAKITEYETLLSLNTHPANLLFVCNTSDYLAMNFYVTRPIGSAKFHSHYMASGPGVSLYDADKITPFEWYPMMSVMTTNTYEVLLAASALHNYAVTAPGVIDDYKTALWLSLLAIPPAEHLK